MKDPPDGRFNTTPPVLPDDEPVHHAIHNSDIAMFGKRQVSIWIHDGRAKPLTEALPPSDGMPTMPAAEFPFSRLASVILPEGGTTFLYHQINGTTIAEEQWDVSLNEWIATSYITISSP